MNAPAFVFCAHTGDAEWVEYYWTEARAQASARGFRPTDPATPVFVAKLEYHDPELAQLQRWSDTKSLTREQIGQPKPVCAGDPRKYWTLINGEFIPEGTPPPPPSQTP